MKTHPITLISLLLLCSIVRAADTDLAAQHAAAVGENVLQLLETQDVEGFAEKMAYPHPFNRKRVSDSARLVLNQAARLGLAASRIQLRVKAVVAKATGTSATPETKGMPTSFGIRIVLLGEPMGDSPAAKPLQGEYELALGFAIEFPDGWRTIAGIRWSRFPDGIADERTKREVMLVSNIDTRAGVPLRAADDPALAALGNTVGRFLQQRDEKILETEAMVSFEEIWEALLRKLNATGVDKVPSREDVEDSWNMRRGQWVGSARGVLAQAAALGVDFSTAEVTLLDVTAEHPYMRGVYGSVNGITAEPLQFTFSVKSGEPSNMGHPIGGEYTLTTSRGKRGPNRWTIEDKIRWEKLPDGLLREKELADLEFENYVGEHGTLPPGTAAPDVEIVRLDNGTRTKLSDFRGEVVVLDWWATWCGPCQGPMAELQLLTKQHPEWQHRVKIIALSIDDELREARTHLAKRGWTNTFNAWAGPGGWTSAAAKQFRLHAVPTCYVIDVHGKVALAGPPMGLSLTNVITDLLP
ncbi:MAG: TlpA family protein disulfide reductase [Verrucomicrobiales bacterium]|nr:TlpA family protein disulfide reductase [Planctomycetota bacterium]MCP5523594.1 TlpA family protein disulfide reductase [Verrucomicrobiales bacterium]